MKLNSYFVSYALLISAGMFLSCSSIDEEAKEVSEPISVDLITTFSESEFQRNLDNVSAVVMQTRAAELDEKIALNAISPFVEDGLSVKQQLLADETLDESEILLIENLTDEELAILSVYANSYSRPTNPSLHCLGEALTGGGSVAGGITVAFIKKVGVRTALRLACAALGEDL